ncbi:MAG: hypothetical protein R2715_03195 [Ilumatobacteraceae bacterium]
MRIRLDQAAEQARSAVPYLPAGAEVWAFDADGYVVRPGPRVVAGIEQMAAVLHGLGTPDERIVRRIDDLPGATT